jgi:septum site-determining protein MinD
VGPVRSGQQIYAAGTSLVVLGSVSPGAEVIADDSIHVYGALRGRAIAGAKGNPQGPHSIASNCRPSCSPSRAPSSSAMHCPQVIQEPVHIRLDNEQLPYRPNQIELQGSENGANHSRYIGQGGVGKTTTSAALSTGLAQRGHKTVVIDFDIGLRNLDLIMGCERRVVYDFVNVINGEANLNQALIKDKRCENLFILPASQTRDKDALTREGVEKILDQLAEMQFDYIVCDSPAGIESGALMALYFADEAIVTTNPEVSSVRDSDRILGILASKSRRAERGEDPIKEHLLLTRYCPTRVNRGDMLSVQDVQEILAIKLLGVIPESQAVLRASNSGEPVILDKESDAGQAYEDAVARLLGDTKDFRFLEEEKKGFFSRLFGS